MIAAVVAAVMVSVATGVMSRWLARISTQLNSLRDQLEAAQFAHDHQLAELSRRLQGIEFAANRAETEARKVSHQLVGLARSLAETADSL